ncbi:MAG: asparaginase [Planctomycetota bacterium]|nr:asparaginase [Planctomycetota bacterium]
MGHEILVSVTRGGFDESHHFGAYCVVADGKVVRSKGDMETPYFMRSAAKPFQALAVVESGAADRFGFTDEELSLCVGSHNGTPHHAATAKSMLDKCGESPDLLRCGGHRPLGRATYEDYVRRSYVPGRLEDNCSGKHAGMIAAAKAWSEETKTYAEPGHRVQRHNLHNLARYGGVAESDVRIAPDGCAVPSFGVSVETMARAIGAFVAGGRDPAADRLMAAVQGHPEMVAGQGRFDTRLMRTAGGKILAKMGAEGVQVIGVRGREDLGIAIKVIDGAGRAVQALAATLLKDFGVIDANGLVEWTIRTREGDPVGDLRVSL